MTGRVLIRLSFQSQNLLPPMGFSSNALPESNKLIQSSLALSAKVMHLTLVKAEGLLAKDRGGTSDPFAELSLGEQFRKTKVIDKTLNPCWNETFEFDLSKGDSTLSIVLYDYDKGLLIGSSKEYLGSIELSIKELLIRGPMEKWLASPHDSLAMHATWLILL